MFPPLASARFILTGALDGTGRGPAATRPTRLTRPGGPGPDGG